jgi:hypothetical protein
MYYCMSTKREKNFINDFDINEEILFDNRIKYDVVKQALKERGFIKKKQIR